jgi:uncharacterized protein (TIRG00374 family)
MTISRNALLRGTLGIAISLIAIYVLMQSVDLGQALEVLGTASPVWVALMAILVFLDVATRGARWRAILASIKQLALRRVVGYTYIGYLANNILPARLGELVRSHALGEGEGVSRTTVLGTVVVERIIDTLIVVTIAATAVVVLSVRGFMTSAVLFGAAFVGLLVLGLGLAMALHRLPGADRVAAFASRWPRIVALAQRLREGLAVVRDGRTLVNAIVLSLVAWSISISTYLSGGQAVGVELSIAQGALLASGVALSFIVPAGPGNVGTFELVAVEIAKTFGVDPDSAFAMALLVHAMILGVSTVGGVISAIWLRVGIVRTASEPEPD